tara:strand:- start:1088 stop:2038 length:951 start_codon:yes stop_codon:yes gene_type:complete
MEEQKNTDTPQTANTTGIDAFGAPEISEGSDNNLSVEEAFFSPTESDNQSAPQEGQPVDESGNATQEVPYEAKNDEKRYEYWQSQAAKKENELNALKQDVAAAIQAQRAQQAQQAQQQPQGQSAQREFPPPPQKPEKPRGFSREEAWTDPNSASAQYLDEVETWQDNMNQYRDLRSQYDVAVLREKFDNQEKAKRIEEAKRQEWARSNAQKQEVYEHVQGHYGLDPQSAEEFVNTMSNPESINLDNLVQLYRMNKAGSTQVPSQGPSEAFQQTKNAQQVPSPMGVMPGQGNQPQRSDTDTIMDDLINSHKAKNPWT